MKTISVTTHIQSPPDVVWQILTGFRAYPDWNPFITRASGDIKVGQRLTKNRSPGHGRNDVPAPGNRPGTRTHARMVRDTRHTGAL